MVRALAWVLWATFFVASYSLEPPTDASSECAFYCIYQPHRDSFIRPEDFRNLSCSHFVYGFATVGHDYTLEPPSGFDLLDFAYKSNFAVLRDLHYDVPSVQKVYLGVYNGKVQIPFLSNEYTRSAVAKDAVDMVAFHHLHGLFLFLDSDHMFSRDMLKFLQEMRRQMTEQKVNLDIVLAVHAHRITRGKKWLREMLPLVSTVYLMADEVPANEDPRIAIAVDALKKSDDVNAEDSISGNVDELLRIGVPRSKLIVGLSAWTRSYKLSDGATTARHGSPVKGPGLPGNRTHRFDGKLAFPEVCQLLNTVQIAHDDVAGYSFFTKGDTWYSLNLPDDHLKRKLRWIAKKNLAGVGLSSLVADDRAGVCGKGPYPLNSFISREFKCAQEGSEEVERCTRFCMLRPGKIEFKKLRPEWCSHLVLQSAQLEVAFSGKSDPVTLSQEILDTIADYKAWRVSSKPKLVIGVGDGQPNDRLRVALGSVYQRNKVIETLKTMLEDHGASGVLISWTDSGMDITDMVRHESFLTELRHGLAPDEEVHVAVHPVSSFNNRYNYTKLCLLADYIIVQGHRFHSYDKLFTGHHSPLFSNGEALQSPWMTIQGHLGQWVSKHCPRDKLLVGVTAEGMNMVFTAARIGSDHEIGDAANRIKVMSGQRANTGGLVTQTEMCELTKLNDTKVVFIEPLGVPYAMNDNQFYAFDNKHSMQIKAAWASLNRYAGVAMYGLESDNPQGECPEGEPFPMLRTIANTQVCNLCRSNSTLVPDTPKAVGEHCREGLAVVCGYRLPNADESDALEPEYLPFDKCTEFVVEYARLNKEGELAFDGANVTERLKRLHVLARESKPPRRVICAIKCVFEKKYLESVLKNAELVQNMIDHMREFGFSGVELSFDRALESGTKELFNDFVESLRNKIAEMDEKDPIDSGCSRTISVRVPVWTKQLAKHYELSTLNSLHHVVLEPFEILSNTTQLTSPLFATAGYHRLDVDSTVSAWLASGLQRAKIVIFMPTYAISQRLDMTSRLVADSRELVPQQNLCLKLNRSGIISHFNYVSMSHSATDGSMWFSFESQQTITYKLQYVQRERLGGVGLATVNEDDPTNQCHQGAFPLLTAVNMAQCPEDMRWQFAELK